MDRIQAHVYCPSCGYMISVVEKMRVRYDYPCPMCRGKNISEFVTVRKIKKEE